MKYRVTVKGQVWLVMRTLLLQEGCVCWQMLNVAHMEKSHV
jgi:hypothetical protein